MSTSSIATVFHDVALHTRRRLIGTAVPVTVSTGPVDEPCIAFDLNRERELAIADGLQQGLAMAEQRIEAAVEDARRELQSSFDEVEDRRQSEHEQQLRRLDVVLKTIVHSSAKRMLGLESQAAALAYTAVCRILGPDEQRQRTLHDLVRTGIAQLRGQPVMSIRLHPDDLRELRSNDAFSRLAQCHPRVLWQPDSDLDRGGCILDTQCGSLDASLTSQLERISVAWKSVVADRGDPAEEADAC